MDSHCIDGTLMPAVDHPSPGGFIREAARALLRPIIKPERAVGMQVTIYKPAADPDRKAGRALAEFLAGVLRQTKAHPKLLTLHPTRAAGRSGGLGSRSSAERHRWTRYRSGNA